MQFANHTNESTRERSHSSVSSAPRGSHNVQLANHTNESTQERSHSNVSSVTSTMDRVAVLDVTLGYTNNLDLTPDCIII